VIRRAVDDLGGTRGWGPVRPPAPDEPVFAEPWEGRAFAITLLTIGRISGRNVDAFRHALGRLDPEAYHRDGYYGRWLNAAELMLVDSAILAPAAVDARVRTLRGAPGPEPVALEPARPDHTPGGPGSLRAVAEAPAFTPGRRVRARGGEPAGPTRLPTYVRGRSGIVELVPPAAVFPDTNTVFVGENPQHVYSVRFDSRELWGADAEPFDLTIELYESYLEPTG